MSGYSDVGSWPISGVAARLIEVRSVGRRGLDLLTLSSSPLTLCRPHRRRYVLRS